jgi:hypothetical protein
MAEPSSVVEEPMKIITLSGGLQGKSSKSCQKSAIEDLPVVHGSDDLPVF